MNNQNSKVLSYNEKIYFLNHIIINFDKNLIDNEYNSTNILSKIINDLIIYEDKTIYDEIDVLKILYIPNKNNQKINDLNINEMKLQTNKEYIEFKYNSYLLNKLLYSINYNLTYYTNYLNNFEEDYLNKIKEFDKIVYEYRINNHSNKNNFFEFYMLKNEKDEFIENYKKKYGNNEINFVVNKLNNINIYSMKKSFNQIRETLINFENICITNLINYEMFEKFVVKNDVIKKENI